MEKKYPVTVFISFFGSLFENVSNKLPKKVILTATVSNKLPK